MVRRQIPSDAVPKACLKSRAEKIPKSVGARTHPCLTPLRMSKGLEELPLNCTVPYMIVWKESIMLCNFGGQSIFGRIWKRPSLLARSNAFVRSHGSDIQGHHVVLCTSPGVGEGRRLCLLLTFQLRGRTVIQDRHVLPASAVGSRWPLQRLCQWRWEGRCLCSCWSRSSLPCSWREWWSWRPLCLVVQILLAITDRGVHVENAVRVGGGGGGGEVPSLPGALPGAKLSMALLALDSIKGWGRHISSTRLTGISTTSHNISQIVAYLCVYLSPQPRTICVRLAQYVAVELSIQGAEHTCMHICI